MWKLKLTQFKHIIFGKLFTFSPQDEGPVWNQTFFRSPYHIKRNLTIL